jgi:MFS family permease
MLTKNLRREDQNCLAYILIYGLVGMMTGLVFDALVTYLLAVSPATANSMAAFMGLATFLAAFFAALAPRIGFKILISLAALTTAAALILVALTRNPLLTGTGVVLMISGTTLFDVIFSPFIAAYTTSDNRTSYFSKALFVNILGIIIGTALGGPLIVWSYAVRLRLPYQQALLLTRSLESLDPTQFQAYIQSHRLILLLFALIPILMLWPALRIKESPADHQAEAEPTAAAVIKGASRQGILRSKLGMPSLLRKPILLFMLFVILMRLSGALIVPQLSIYLTNIGINRVTVSLLGTVQYIAMLIFVLFSNQVMRLMGKVKAIAVLCLASAPFMIILANGYHFKSSAVLIIGTALFIRAGLVNTIVPIVNTLSMELIPRNLRSLYSSLIFVMQSIAQIAVGLFAGLYLLKDKAGYANAYYYSAVIFIIAQLILLFFFAKSHNQPHLD